jgi:uncharacterized Zn finger protein (UPF0148 family)
MSPQSNTHTIACGSCKVPAKRLTEPEGNGDVTCPLCNRRDSYNNVMAAVKQHVTHAIAHRLNESFRSAARGNSFLKFEAKPLGNPSFRWIALGI